MEEELDIYNQRGTDRKLHANDGKKGKTSVIVSINNVVVIGI